MKLLSNRCALLLVCAGAAAFSSPVGSATIVTARNGMTLYVFDRDKNGVPTCYDNCAKQWPPYLSTGGENRGAGWGTVKRKGGAMQWTYHNRPVYFYADDKKPGDANGDRVGRIWHVIRE
jgi:predicted lipoprotein with Yx(FWY)xxD motif